MDSHQFALFLASFISLYKTTHSISNKLINSNLSSFIAGIVAGYAIMFDRNKARRKMIALYFSTRTVHFVSRHLWRTRIQQRIQPTITNDTPMSTPSDTSPRSLTSPDRQFHSPLNTTTASHDHSNKLKYFLKQASATLIMMFSSAQILNAYVTNPDTLHVPFTF
jgi:hypothetical protein